MEWEDLKDNDAEILRDTRIIDTPSANLHHALIRDGEGIEKRMVGFRLKEDEPLYWMPLGTAKVFINDLQGTVDQCLSQALKQ